MSRRYLSIVLILVIFTEINGQVIKKQDLVDYSKEQLIDSLTDRYNDALLDKSYHLKEIRLLQNELLKYQHTAEFHNLIKVDTADISNTYLEIETDTSYSDQTKNVESIYQEVRDNRNRRMQRIFVESQDVSHFAFSLLDVGDSLTPSFNANVSSHFFVLPTHWPIGLTLNPKFRLRMFLNQPSAPIRTPSNLIGATIFRHGGGFLSSIGGYRIYSASFYHHSNGQDPGSYNSDGSINLLTGNFGVNYLAFKVQQGNYTQTKKSKLNKFFSIAYQKDFIIGKPQESNGLKELEAEYGQDRINFTFSRISIKSSKNLSQSMTSEVKYLRFGLEGSFVFPINGAVGSSFDELINLEGQFYWKIPGTPSLIFHSSFGWLGHDYYNIYFNESTFIFRIGLAASIITGFGT